MLAAAKGVKADSVHRLLRALTAQGIFKEVQPGVWANNRGSSVLRSDHPSSVVPFVLHWGDESYRGHERMYEALAEGAEISWKQAHGGVGYWDWLAQPERKMEHDRFDMAMISGSEWMMSALLQMLSIIGGKERTHGEWEALLGRAGFALTAVHPRSDYRPPTYAVRSAQLTVALDEEETVVEAVLEVCPSYQGGEPLPLVLDGRDNVRLLSVAVDGRALQACEYERTADALTILPSALPPKSGATYAACFEVATRVAICPRGNTSLQGLFLTGGCFCTDCEAEGFRHYAVWEDAQPKPCYLFALVAGQLACVEGSHCAGSGRTIALRVWAAPEEVEAGRADFALRSLQAAMRWGVNRPAGVRCGAWHVGWWAAQCVGAPACQMVAVPELNGGAMENLGLNVFDASLVLACPATATDDDYAAVERTVAHEYLHHWSGNRVGVRDWFQLALKEGLTVFREQEFAAARQHRGGTSRIEAAAALRGGAFDEDAGPRAHAPRPAAVACVENFYTATTYDKGAEIVRTLDALLGRPAFRAGLATFLARHRGSTATCEDLLAAMADASAGGGGAESSGGGGDGASEGSRGGERGGSAGGERGGGLGSGARLPGGERAAALGWDPQQMLRWYDQVGTPQVEAAGEYNPVAQTFTLHLHQRVPPAPGQPRGAPLPIPVACGLLARSSGRPLPLRLASGALAPVDARRGGGAGGAPPTSLVLLLSEARQSWVFGGVEEEPLPSLLRGCSAPVVLGVRGQRDADLALLASADPDPYARWAAGQELATRALLKVYHAAVAKRGKGGKGGAGAGGAAAAAEAAAHAAARAAPPLAAVLRPLLAPPGAAVAGAEFGAWALALPDDGGVYEKVESVDPGALQLAREALERALAADLVADLAPAVRALDAALATMGAHSGGGRERQQDGASRQGPAAAADGGTDGQARPGEQGTAYAYNAEGAALRAMQQACLYLLAALGEEKARALSDLEARLAAAANLSDAWGAAQALERAGAAAAAAAQDLFAERWGATQAGLHKWMELVAGSERGRGAAAAAELLAHPRFRLGSPAACEAVFHAFADTNSGFHAADGSGYAFIADAVLQLDPVNPQQAAGVAACLADWCCLEPARRAAMRGALARLAAAPRLSANAREVVAAALGG
eukprot:scaffold1.g5869.t1